MPPKTRQAASLQGRGDQQGISPCWEKHFLQGATTMLCQRNLTSKRKRPPGRGLAQGVAGLRGPGAKEQAELGWHQDR